MITFHYVICTIARKDKYHVKKLVFINQKLEQIDDLNLNKKQILSLKNDINKKDFTEINDSRVNLESFLKNVNITCHF